MDKLFPAQMGLIGRVGLGALLLALFLAPVIGGYPSGAAYGADVSLNALRALVCVAALCSALSPATTQKEKTPLDRMGTAAVWGLAGLTILSLLVHSAFLTSPVLLFAMLPATLDWVCIALLFMVCANLAGDRTARGMLIGAIAVGAAWTAVAGVREYGQNVQTHQTAQRISATFFDPNFVAGFLALVLPLVVAWFCLVRERLGVLLLGILAALMLGALAATGSRAGVGIALAGLLVSFALALVCGKSVRLPWARVGALLVAFALIGFGFRGPLTARVGDTSSSGGGQEHSGSFRKWTWRGTSAMAKANPVWGTGPGTFPFRYPPYALVAKTELAHSSYYQLAAEQGFPALLASVLTILAAGLLGLRSVFKRPLQSSPDESSEAAATRLLLCGLIGTLVAGAARGIFDSEWSILGNAFPFWALAGLTAGTAHSQNTEVAQTVGKRGAWWLAVPALGGMLFALLLLHNSQTVDAAQTKIRAHQPIETGSVWPPDPNLLYWTGKPEEAARVEPSGRRFFQWARATERTVSSSDAIPLFARASSADPNNLQTLRALAQAQEKSGDQNAALATWKTLIARFEGPVGQIRAIPELPETYPAFAYVAVARAAVQASDNTGAIAAYQKAAKVIEAYSRTTPVYQQMELASAVLNNVDVTARRREIRQLYGEIVKEWAAQLTPPEADTLRRREAETETRLDAFAQPEDAKGALPLSSP